MGEIERNRDAGHIIRTKPFIRQPEMGMKVKAAAVEFLVELRDAVLKTATCDLDIKVAQPKIQQPLIRPRGPIGEIVLSRIRGRIWCRFTQVMNGHRLVNTA